MLILHADIACHIILQLAIQSLDMINTCSRSANAEMLRTKSTFRAERFDSRCLAVINV